MSSSEGPVFICGHPRAGTTALYANLRKHPEFFNEKYFDKEPKFYQQIIGDRPWGRIPTLNPRRLDRNRPVDDAFVSRAVRLVHELHVEFLGGPSGRYLCAYPYDVFHIPYIAREVPSARFIVVLRDPISNVWSMLNYPYETSWHPNSRPEEGYYDRTDIWDNMLRWSQPYWSLASLIGTEFWPSIMLVRYDWFADNVDKALENIFQFLGIEGLPAIAGSLKQNIHHSSFVVEREQDVEANFTNGQLSAADFTEKRIRDAVRHPEIVRACRHYLEVARQPLTDLGFEYAIPADVDEDRLG